MKIIIRNNKVMNIVCLMLVILSGLTVSNMSKASELDDRALPILNLIKALKYQDEELFKSIYSKKQAALLLEEYGDWKEVFKAFTEGFKEIIPSEYEMNEVTYEGRYNSDKILFIIKGVKVPLLAMRVVKEDGIWKLDEK